MRTFTDYLADGYGPYSDAWLNAPKENLFWDADRFFNSRVVYYPGSYTDGSIVRDFNRSHTCQNFLYVDYSLTKDELLKNLNSDGKSFKHYSTVHMQSLDTEDLSKVPFIPSIRPSKFPVWRPYDASEAFALWVVFERNEDADDTVGQRRFSVLFMYSDAIATFDVLFGKRNNAFNTPFAVVIEDYGFGLQYSRFGQGGLLQEVVSANAARPELLIVGNAAIPWTGYMQADALPSIGGMHGSQRFIYKRTPSGVITPIPNMALGSSFS